MKRATLLLAAATCAVLGVASWWTPGASPSTPPVAEGAPAASERPVPAGLRISRPATVEPRLHLPLRLRPAEPPPRAASHPLTAEHRELQHELGLFRRLDDAFDRQDHHAMRTVIEIHRERHPEDPHAMRAGYEILADCLDPARANDESTLARAEAYYRRERASTLRRFVRRTCLERIG